MQSIRCFFHWLNCFNLFLKHIYVVLYVVFKAQILSCCCSGDEYLWGWVATRGDLPLLHNPNCGSGAGDVFPSWSEGRKTSRVFFWHHLCRALCLLCLPSCPSRSCSAFPTSHRKVRLFECMGNNSFSHWCQKYKLITGGKNILNHGSYLGEIDLFMRWSSLHPLCPLLMLHKAVAADVLLEDEGLSWTHWAGFLLLLLTPGVISPLWYLSDGVCSGLSAHCIILGFFVLLSVEISGILMWEFFCLRLSYSSNHFCEHDEDTDFCA